jgi:(2Fe-2S) ferredoxin
VYHGAFSLAAVTSRFRLSVCKGPDCRARKADAVFAAVQAEVAATGLAEKCKVQRGGCYGLCEFGPNVVVRPDTNRPADPFSRENYELVGSPGEVHYAEMTPEKAVEVVRQHIARGEPVEALQGVRGPVRVR